MNLQKKAAAYIAVVCVSSVPAIYFLCTRWAIYDWKALVFWAAMAVISESFGITLPSGMGVSVSLAVNLASLVIGGPLMAAAVAAAGFMLRVVKHRNKGYVHIFNTPFYKTLFNTCQGIISAGISGMVYTAAGGLTGTFSLVPVLIALMTYILINSAIITGLMSLLNRQSFASMWAGSIKDVLPSSIAIGSIGIIIALAYIGYGAGAVLLFFGPLLLARYSFKMYVDMRNTYMETIQALNKTIEAKDAYTSGHASRVQDYAVRLAEAVKLPEDKIQNIRNAAILHDIGKIGIDDNILKKPSGLTTEEYAQIKRHPIIGAEIIRDVDFLKDVAAIVRHHHERYDGKGYPDGLKDGDIPIEASILAIADVYDAMTSSRPYRKPLSKEAALEEIRANAGTQLHPELANIFQKIMNSDETGRETGCL